MNLQRRNKEENSFTGFRDKIAAILQFLSLRLRIFFAWRLLKCIHLQLDL